MGNMFFRLAVGGWGERTEGRCVGAWCDCSSYQSSQKSIEWRPWSTN